MIPKDQWVWYGFAGHFIGGHSCAYHLCTRIGNKVISTVGAYYPRSQEEMVTLGIGPEDYYETMIFECDGEDENGNPNIHVFTELERHMYGDSLKAEQGHRAICDRIAKGDE